MNPIFAVGMLALIAVLAIVSRAVRAPYPVVFVLGGSLLAFVPGVPPLHVPPDLGFALVLPPLLFGGGWMTEWRQFMRHIRPIAQLSIGLVIVSTLVVAAVMHAIAPELGWAAAFVLGAVVSPPDAVVAEAMSEQVSLPRRIAVIAAGESLVNDASALVIYRFAVAAVVTGTFSLGAALGNFVVSTVGGVAFGLGVGYLSCEALVFLNRRKMSDESINVVVSLFTPYLAYLPADQLHLSGVLAVVTAGIYCSRQGTRIFDSQTRLVASSIWEMLFFLFNGALFIAIGLQLRTVIAGLGAYSPATLAIDVFAVCTTTVLIRIVWMFPASYIPRKLFPAIRRREGEEPVPTAALFVLSWMGMRGMVSLAAALAIPVVTASGAPFPNRDLIVFLTYCVIVATLVGQGLSLPWVVRRLGIREPVDQRRLENSAQVRIAAAALDRLSFLENNFASTRDWEIAGRLRSYYESRMRHFESHIEERSGEADDKRRSSKPIIACSARRLMPSAMHSARCAVPERSATICTGESNSISISKKHDCSNGAHLRAPCPGRCGDMSVLRSLRDPVGTPVGVRFVPHEELP